MVSYPRQGLLPRIGAWPRPAAGLSLPATDHVPSLRALRVSWGGKHGGMFDRLLVSGKAANAAEDSGQQARPGRAGGAAAPHDLGPGPYLGCDHRDEHGSD